MISTCFLHSLVQVAAAVSAVCVASCGLLVYRRYLVFYAAMETIVSRSLLSDV